MRKAFGLVIVLLAGLIFSAGCGPRERSAKIVCDMNGKHVETVFTQDAFLDAMQREHARLFRATRQCHRRRCNNASQYLHARLPWVWKLRAQAGKESCSSTTPRTAKQHLTVNGSDSESRRGVAREERGRRLLGRCLAAASERQAFSRGFRVRLARVFPHAGRACWLDGPSAREESGQHALRRSIAGAAGTPRA